MASSSPSINTATLSVWKDGSRIETMPLKPGLYSVGRTEDAAITVEHPSCSRKHATITVSAVRAELRTRSCRVAATVTLLGRYTARRFHVVTLLGR